MLRTLSIFSVALTAFSQSFDLSSLNWTLKNQNGSIAIPASIPSQAHLDLLKAGIITEPLYGINDFTERWIVSDNWTYTADLSPWLSSGVSDQSLLVFFGLDTIANITFAGHPVAWVNNEFRQYVFDVSDFVTAGPSNSDTNITVAFESAWTYGQNISTLPTSEQFPSGNGVFGEYTGVFEWIRKVASDFGWDWAPAFVPTGIFKSAYIISLPTNTTDPAPAVWIEETSIDIFKAGESFSVPPVQTADWIVNVTLALRSATEFNSSNLTMSIASLGISSGPLTLPVIDGNASTPTWINVSWAIPDGIPQRWFPHNLGTPQLYDLVVDITLPNVAQNVSFTARTGFRTIRLVQTPYTAQEVSSHGITPGDNYHFEINGNAFYSKGANLVPFDPFYSRITTDKVRWILESSMQAGLNMVRVWGGGHYQPSAASISGGVYDFYALCDELGVLAWSEFEFSDALYPVAEFMLENIEPEIRQNVRRVNRHPSVAQWAGGNEIEGIARGSGEPYLDEFLTLFQGILHDITVSESNSIPYTDCSTTTGVLSLNPYILRLGNATAGDLYGNSERFDYDANAAFDYTTYPTARFVNEFGFTSMPSFYTWEDVLTAPEDFNFNSEVVLSRQHHPPANSLAFPNPNAQEGQNEMMSAVMTWLPTPGTSDSNQTFTQWCYSTQVFQSMTITSEIAWYRRGAGQPENNLGAIVWQLNDIWPAPSWSSLEYSGRWKVLHYGLARAYSPVTIYPFWTASSEFLEVTVTSDLWEDVSGTASLTWYDWFGNPINFTSHNFTVPTLNNSMIYTATGLDTILPPGNASTDVWLLVNVTVPGPNGVAYTNEQYFNPISLADANLVDPKILVAFDDTLTFTLLAQGGVAPWTWIDHPSGTIGYFVDAKTNAPSNGFYLIPGISRTVKFVYNNVLSTTTPNPADFVVRSLWDNTHLKTAVVENESTTVMDGEFAQVVLGMQKN